MGDLFAPLLFLVTALVLLGLWWFSNHGQGTRAVVGSDGVQEITIVVRNGYRPSRVVVKRGTLVRLLFDREEDDPCSERVIFSDFHQERRLAPFAVSSVQFIPTRAGEFLFTCAMGMYQGWLVVEEPRAEGQFGRLLRALTPTVRERSD